MIYIDEIKDLNLRETFECGQCFRWNEEEDGSYTGTAMGRVANIMLEGDRLIIDGSGDENFWRNYLDLDRDYSEIKKRLVSCEPEIMPMAIEAGAGIRILNQELWETVVDFIISQNNNIPRIKGCIERLAENFGDYIGEFRNREFYNLPSPKRLAELKPSDLAPIRLGYRDKYLIETAKRWMCIEQGLSEKGSLSVFSNELSNFSGVGPKVEACIRLFGIHDLSSFPIDVWVKRLMSRFYGFAENDTKGMERFACERFGEYAGLAQQYLFNYIRTLDKQ